jgi:transaldolase
MKIFLDTANPEEIKKGASLGIIDGVTTNPTLLSKEDKPFDELIDEILSLVDGPVSIEVTGKKSDDMVKEARELSKLGENVVVKIPMIEEGLKAVRKLGNSVKTNVTLIFSANQALLAAKSGATYASIFIGRLDDVGQEGMKVVEESVQIYRIHGFKTKLIVASIRHPMHVVSAALSGAPIATVPWAVLERMVKHPLTDVGLERFLSDWERWKRRKR